MDKYILAHDVGTGGNKAVLVDLVPTRVLRLLPAMRTVVDPTTGQPTKKRDFLESPTLLLQRRYRMVYLDPSGRLGVRLQGEIPEWAQERRRAYFEWLARGLTGEMLPPEQGGRRRRPGARERFPEEGFPPGEVPEERLREMERLREE